MKSNIPTRSELAKKLDESAKLTENNSSEPFWLDMSYIAAAFGMEREYNAAYGAAEAAQEDWFDVMDDFQGDLERKMASVPKERVLAGLQKAYQGERGEMEQGAGEVVDWKQSWNAEAPDEWELEILVQEAV